MSTGIYFDGETSLKRAAVLRLTDDALEIAADGILVLWPYGEIQSLSAPDGLLRVTRKGAGLARLEIRDADMMAALDARAGGIDRSGLSDRRSRRKVVVWSLAAVASLAVVAVFGLPAIVTRLTPLVPTAMEQRLGATIDRQARGLLDGNKSEPLDCGLSDKAAAGRAAFQKLVGRLEETASLDLPLHATVLRRPEVNAVALPGGYVYVFRGLIEKAETPDELAGVIAHEIGHVANRDGTRAMLQTAGLTFLFGTLLGDFGGGTAVVLATRTVLQSSYSREAESAADLFGARLTAAIGGEPRGLGTLLQRIAGRPGALANFLLDHPEADARMKTIDTVARPARLTPLLTPDEWSALKKICEEK